MSSTRPTALLHDRLRNDGSPVLALGKRGPHRGGSFLKTLSKLDELHVRYAYTDDFENAEKGMIERFASLASADSCAALYLVASDKE